VLFATAELLVDVGMNICMYDVCRVSECVIKTAFKRDR